MVNASDFIDSKIRINYRPLKVAYFVKHDDEAAFEHVIRLCCTQWGGIHNPIIAVNDENNIAGMNRYLLSINPPDIFVSFLHEIPSPDAPLMKLLSELFPDRTISIHHGPHFEKRDQSLHALSVLPTASPDAATSQPEGPPLKSHLFEGTSNDKLALLTMFGGIFPGQEQYYQQKVSIERPRVSLDSPELWQLQMDRSEYASVVNLTSRHVSFIEYQNAGNHTFQVVLTDCIDGMAFYWNIRGIQDAMRLGGSQRRTWLFPMQLLENNGLDRMIDAIRGVPAIEGATCSFDITFIPWKKENRQIMEAALSAMPRVRQSVDSAQMTLFLGDHVRVPRECDPQRDILFYFSRPVLPTSIKLGVRPVNLPERVTLRYEKDEVPVSPPSSFITSTPGTLALDVMGEIWDRYPRDPMVARTIIPNAWFSNYGLTVELLTSSQKGHLAVALPREEAASDAYFRARGFVPRVSSSGRYATAFLGLIGGMSQINNLASVSIFRILDTLATRSTKKVAQRLATLLPASTVTEEDLIRHLNDVEVISEWKTAANTLNVLKQETSLPKSELFEVLTKLSKLQILRRGLFILCDNCGVSTWHLLHNLTERITCPGCGTSMFLPIESPPGSGNELQWHYTLNTLANRVMDQDVLPHLLAINYLTRGIEAYSIQPGLELLRNGERNAAVEFDFVYVVKQRLHGGECKTGSLLTDKDYETARKAQKLGFKEFSFCTTKKFSLDTKAANEKLEKELGALDSPMSIRVLEGQELLGGELQ